MYTTDRKTIELAFKFVQTETVKQKRIVTCQYVCTCLKVQRDVIGGKFPLKHGRAAFEGS